MRGKKGNGSWPTFVQLNALNQRKSNFRAIGIFFSVCLFTWQSIHLDEPPFLTVWDGDAGIFECNSGDCVNITNNIQSDCVNALKASEWSTESTLIAFIYWSGADGKGSVKPTNVNRNFALIKGFNVNTLCVCHVQMNKRRKINK